MTPSPASARPGTPWAGVSACFAPAPRPLPWYALSLSQAGEVEVDTATEVPQGTFLKV